MCTLVAKGRIIMSKLNFIAIATVLAFTATLTQAQTSSFTYQGRFTDGGSAANGAYEMQFRLFDAPSVGNQIGSTITNSAVNVSNGVFTVQLDYGASAFSGADRYLEIGVRPAGDSNPYTFLAPRQQLTSAVYAIRAGSASNADNAANATNATNSTQLGGVAAGQYVQTSDSRLSDARTPTAGSSNYIQNTNNQQTADFNISGNGTAGGSLSANSINTSSNYKIVGQTVLSISGSANDSNTFTGLGAGAVTAPGPIAGLGNSFFGGEAGAANTSGSANSFFGTKAGAASAAGNFSAFFGYRAGNATVVGGNSFFGGEAGAANTKGAGNSFFGRLAGRANTEGNFNTFVGHNSGLSNKIGGRNSFFGTESGGESTEGEWNAFFGAGSGYSNTIGSRNSFFGGQAGSKNGYGNDNVYIGYEAGRFTTGATRVTLLGVESDTSSALDLTNATAIGAHSYVTQSNSLVLGSIDGVNGATEDTNVGIGTNAPKSRLHIAFAGNNLHLGHAGCSSGLGLGFGATMSGCTNFALLGSGLNTVVNRPSGGKLIFAHNNFQQMAIAPDGVVTIDNLSGGGMTHLCHNGSNQISTCGSSLRYKTNIQPFFSGLSVLNRLRPITFDWKDGGMHDLGFGAEEIAAIEPLLVTRNNKGEVEGVKYDRITAVLVNAVKEQQEQIKQLKKLVCQRNRRAAACR